MNSTSLKLDKLPIEVLHRIISLGPCEAALILLRVNRTLHRACNDSLVFKSIINNRDSNGVPNWHCTPLSIESPTSTWARYALADSKAAKWPTETYLSMTRIPDFVSDRFVSWAPQLMASHHPFIDSASASSLFYSLSTDEWSSLDDKHAVAFCITATLLSAKPIDDQELMRPRPNTDRQNTRSKLAESLMAPLYKFEDALQMSNSSPGERTQELIQAILAIGTFALLLRDILNPESFTRPWPYPLNSIDSFAASLQMPIPAARKMPFLTMMGLPLPFAVDASEKFASCHLPRMTSKEFFEDGEWVGYYSYGTEQWMHFDPPMRGIRFMATPFRTGNLETRLKLHTNGVDNPATDNVGPFGLDGQVSQETGKLTLTKRYSAGFIWDWHCVVTPFGIVGTWGGSGVRNVGGWVWLWKASWSS